MMINNFHIKFEKYNKYINVDIYMVNNNSSLNYFYEDCSNLIINY